MKKLTAFLITVFAAIALSAPAYAATAIIDDKAALLDSAELAEIEQKAQETADYTGWNIAIVTTNDGFGEDGYNAMNYAEQYYDEAFGADSSSIVYLIDLDYRHIAMDGELLNYINKQRLDTILDKCEDRYFDYDDVGVFQTFLSYVEQYYTSGEVDPDEAVGPQGDDFRPSDYSSESPIPFSVPAAVIFGLIGAVIALLSALSAHKHKKPSATSYLDKNTLNIYQREDRYIRQHTSVTTISSSSGGSGGGRSSGGRSHGGGGRGGRR